MTQSVTVVPVVNNHGPGVGQILIDTNNLITLAQAGQLDLLLRTNREVIITDQIYDEAVNKALEHSNPSIRAEGAAIRDWLLQHDGIHGIRFYTPPDDAIPTGTGDLGERSIVAAADYFTKAGNDVIIMSDDFNYFGYNVRGQAAPVTGVVVAGNMTHPITGATITDYPVLSTTSFMNSLLIDGGLSPLEYAFSLADIHSIGRVGQVTEVLSAIGPDTYTLKSADGTAIATYSWGIHGSTLTLLGSGATISGGLSDRVGFDASGGLMVNPQLNNHSLLPQSFGGQFVQLHKLLFVVSDANSPSSNAVIYDSSGNLAYNTLSAELSGLAALDLGVFSGMGLEGSIPSAMWPADIQWDWSTVALDQVSYVAPINGGGAFSDLTAPGIVVSDVSGAYTGRFAQTSDGHPLWQVARSDVSFSQTALVDGFGNATVTTSNGAVAGTFNYTGAIDPDAGPGAYFGATGAAQLDSFSFNDLATGELIGEGVVIKGGERTNGFGGGSGGDTLIARAKATTGQWQTTVTVKREAPQLTAEQQQALIDSASNDNAGAGETRVAGAGGV